MWPLQEFRVIRACLAGVGAGQLQHLLGHVQAVRLAARAYPTGGQQHVDAAARAQVQHCLPGAQFGGGYGVAAAEAGPHRAIGQTADIWISGGAEATCPERIVLAVDDLLGPDWAARAKPE